MITLALQLLVSLLGLAFGAGALRVHRRTPGAPEEHRAMWLLTAAAFLLTGANGLVTASTAVWGVRAGEGTMAMEAAVVLKVVGNDGRGLAMVGFAAMLGLRLLARGAYRPATLWRCMAPLVGWMAAGTVLGVMEGGEEHRNYQMVAILSAVAVVLLLGGLWLAAARDGMDHLLWLALLAYAVREAMDVSLASILAWLNAPQVWLPSYSSFQMLAVAAYLLMLACVARRLEMARRGAAVPALFQLDRSHVPAAARARGGRPWR